MTVDRETIDIYDRSADVYEANRPPRFTERASALAEQTEGAVVDHSSFSHGRRAFFEH